MLKYCLECSNFVEYSIQEKQLTQTIKGTDYNYIGKIAFCKKCNNEIFVAEVRDYNLNKLDEAFRKKEKLITVAEIKLIMEKYKIGKRPLSLLLGWGELTLTRYIDGDIPTKQYSEILKKLLDENRSMEKLLEKNKYNISGVAYRKCSKALAELNSKTELSFNSTKKIDNVVKYLLLGCSDVTPLALQKLLYYSQAFFKVFTGEFLFAHDCEAWTHGPVYNEIYHQYKNYGYFPISNKRNMLECIELTEIEREVLDSVILSFGCYSGKVLESMTHKENPWIETRVGLEKSKNSNKIIEKKLIESYFLSIKIKYNMQNISDIKNYSRDLFNKICDSL